MFVHFRTFVSRTHQSFVVLSRQTGVGGPFSSAEGIISVAQGLLKAELATTTATATAPNISSKDHTSGSVTAGQDRGEHATSGGSHLAIRLMGLRLSGFLERQSAHGIRAWVAKAAAGEKVATVAVVTGGAAAPSAAAQTSSYDCPVCGRALPSCMGIGARQNHVEQCLNLRTKATAEAEAQPSTAAGRLDG